MNVFAQESTSHKNSSAAVVAASSSSAAASNVLVIQRQLTVGAVNDPLEQQADSVADKVMRMPKPDVQRYDADNGQETNPKSNSLAHHITPFIQTKSKGKTATSSEVSHAIQSSRGSGSAMDSGTQSFMSSRFGNDFSGVKIHTDSQSEELNRSLQAKAFTVGNDIYFNQGQYQPQSSEGRHLLAHELTHTLQQGSNSPLVQREPDPQAEVLKEKLKRGEKLSKEEMDFLKSHISKEAAQQILGQTGTIHITLGGGPSNEGDLNRKYRGRLDLRLSGVMALGKSYEGTATTDIDLNIKAATGKGHITLSPPIEANKLSATIRELLFPNNNPVSYDFEFPKDQLKYAHAVDLLGSLSFSISAPKTKTTGAMFTIHHASVPAGVELIVTLSSTTRTTSVEDTKRDVPGNYSLLTPNPRIFGTIGYGKSLGGSAFASTLGVDVPLFYDTSKPFLYGGIGARGALDTNTFGKAGGSVFLGLNLDPLSLQFGLGFGAAFLKDPIQTPSGPAQTFFYSELEGSISYRVVSNLELLTYVTVGGGKNLPTYGTAQLGAGYRF